PSAPAVPAGRPGPGRVLQVPVVVAVRCEDLRQEQDQQEDRGHADPDGARTQSGATAPGRGGEGGKRSEDAAPEETERVRTRGRVRPLAVVATNGAARCLRNPTGEHRAR